MKFILNQDDREIEISAPTCPQPSFSDYGGRTWDHGFIKIDGEEYKAYLDTTWGEYIYFQYNEKWRRTRMQPIRPFILHPEDQYDIDPFQNPPAELKRKGK